MDLDLIVRGGTVVTASDMFQADVGVHAGRIVQLGEQLTPGRDTEVLDATGKYVMPGGVDVHTHLDSPGQGGVTADDFESGTIAAAWGGTTTIVDFCAQEKGQRLQDALTVHHARAAGRAAIDYGFHSVIADPSEEVVAELAELPAVGVTSFKCFMAYKGDTMVDDWTLLQVLDQAKAHGALVMVHAENGDAVEYLRQKYRQAGKTAPKYHALSRPPRTEAEATARAIALAEIVGTPIYIVHVSCAEALEEIERGRRRGVTVYAETCPQYLYLTADDLDRPGFEGGKYVFTPPARDARQHAVLWRALANGTLQAVSSDHAPYHFHGMKDRGKDDFTRIPNGAPGIEERLMLVFAGVVNNLISPSRFVDLVATTPARLFGFYPTKGTLAIGSDADIVIWDPMGELQLTNAALHSHVDYALYEGKRVRGIPVTVLLRGDVVVRDRQYVGQPGRGRFIARERLSVIE